MAWPRTATFRPFFSVMVNIYDSLVFTCKAESNSEVLYVNIENDQVGNRKSGPAFVSSQGSSTCSAVRGMQ